MIDDFSTDYDDFPTKFKTSTALFVAEALTPEKRGQLRSQSGLESASTMSALSLQFGLPGQRGIGCVILTLLIGALSKTIPM